jgi:carboxyl-terminal processing protease
MKNRLLPSTLAIILALAIPATVLVAQNMQWQQQQAQQIEDLDEFLAVYRKLCRQG